MMNELNLLRRRDAIAVCIGTVLASAGLLASGPAVAQAYPAKPITVVVPYPPGGALDTLARVTSKRLSEVFHQTVIVENKPGASGTIGAGYVARAPADGYTLLMGNAGPNAISRFVFSNLSYDPATDFAPVSILVETAFYLAVPASSPIHSVADLIALGKSKDSRNINFGSSGPGGVSHLAGEMLNRAIGSSFVHIPYKGTAPLVQAMLANEVQVAFVTGTDAGVYTQSGKLRLLASTTAAQSPQLPRVPVLSEAGVSGVDIPVWYGLLAPAGTPGAVIDELHQKLKAILDEPDIQRQLVALNYVVRGSSPEDFSALIKADLARYGKAVRAAGLKAE
jgi:tripartite-type tricarboxylate transporter receptor subunit TctC